MDNFNLKQYLAEGKLNELNENNPSDNSDIKRIYELLDEYIPQLTGNQQFKLMQAISKFVTQDKNQY